MTRIENRVVLVTGSSRGIGAAIVRAFAAEARTAETVLEALFGAQPGDLGITSATAGGVTHHYQSFREVRDEVVNARVWGGRARAGHEGGRDGTSASGAQGVAFRERIPETCQAWPPKDESARCPLIEAEPRLKP